MVKLRIGLAVAALAAVTACVPKPAAPPPAEPQPPPPVAPAPAPAAPPADWRDIALTPGTWRYDGARTATFGIAGAEPLFTMRCDQASRRILLARAGVAAGNALTVRTSFGSRSLPLQVQPGTAQLAAVLTASDRLLDEIAFSRGRFTIDVPGMTELVLPAWAEPARVVEDCRG